MFEKNKNYGGFPTVKGLDLELCPFCGGEAILESNKLRYETIYSAYCQKCGAEITGFSEHEAVAAWNRRAQPSEKPLTLDELRQMAGEPVWVMYQDGSGARWGIVQDTEYGLCAVVDNDTAYWFTDVCGTIAYRSKPERSEG